MGEEVVRGVGGSFEGWRRRWAGRRMAEGGRGDSVDLAAREMVVRARV